MKRTHQMPPEALPIRVDARNVLYVNAQSENWMNVEARRDQPVVIRGVPLRGNENFQRQPDGTWKPYSEVSRHTASFTRTDRDMYSGQSTPAMNKTMLALMGEAVLLYVENHPGEFNKAEAASANNEIDRLDKEIEDATKALDGLIEKRNAARRREASALQAIEDEPEMAGPRL